MDNGVLTLLLRGISRDYFILSQGRVEESD